MRSTSAVNGSSVGTSICVIGSGPVGQTVATRLAGGNHDVLLLEAGGRAPSPLAQRLVATAAPAVGDPYPNMQDLLTVAVGGTSDGPKIHLEPGADAGTGIRLRPLDPVDVEARPAARLPGWPLSYDELWAATEVAAKIFGIGSLTRDEHVDLLTASGLRTATFHIADRRLFSDPSLEGVPRLDVLIDAPVASLEAGVDGRIRCAVVRTGDGREIRVHAEAFVVAVAAGSTSRMLLSSTARDERGVANSSGLLGTGLMDHPLVTAGWLVPREGADLDALARFAPRRCEGDLVWPKLVPDPELVRRDVTGQSWATLVPRRMTAQLARLYCAVTPPVGELTGAGAALRTLLRRARDGRLLPRLVRTLGNVATGSEDFGSRWLEGSANFGQAWSLEDPFWAEGGGLAAAQCLQVLQCAEQLPDQANRLVLTDHLDPVGRPMARVHWRWSPEDSRREQAFAEVVRGALHDADLGKVIAPVTFANRHVERWSSHHLSGGARMSADPGTGVVDRRCRSHDHPNLWIAGTSVFPTAGHANPTLTAVATAVIVADDILARPTG